jgi:hypothetical protein
LNKWAESPAGKKYCSMRKAQVLAEINADLVKAKKLKNKEAMDVFARDLERLKSTKNPIFVPFLVFNNENKIPDNTIGHLRIRSIT